MFESLGRPRTVDGGMGRVAASQIDTTVEVPKPRPLSAKEADVLLRADFLAAARSLVESSTRLADQLGARQGAINGVLDVRLHVFTADGMPFVGDYPVPVGSILVTNHGAAKVTYSAEFSKDATVPTVGAGRQVIEPHSTARIAVAARTFSLWGTAADQLSVQVFTGLQAFGIAA